MNEEKDRGEVVLYQPNDTIRLEVRLNKETVWLTQQQIAELFCVKQPAISKHLSNIFKEGELEKDSVHSILEYTASDGKLYKTHFYNLDAILSVGYRVNSVNATAFRRWATTVLKQYLLQGYSINQQLMQMEDRIDRRLESQHDEIQRIKEIQEKQLALDIAKHDSQYAPIPVNILKKAHDRFMIVDYDVYHIGASVKDLGRKWTAIMKMENFDPISLISPLKD